jgi:hypothetical protein
MYRAADVLLAATCSEGCGVPILEAQLCGTPVITTSATAMTEETLFGISVKPVQWIARMDFNSGWMLPSADGIAKALAEIESWKPSKLSEMRASTQPRLHLAYDETPIAEKWKSLIREIGKATASGCGLGLSTQRWNMLYAANKSALMGKLSKRLQEQRSSHLSVLRTAQKRLEYLEALLKVNSTSIQVYLRFVH